MEIKRCTASFRARHVGASEGDLFPSTHELVKRYPQHFEPVEAYVLRRHPQFAPKSADSSEAAKPAAKKASAPRTPRGSK